MRCARWIFLSVETIRAARRAEPELRVECQTGQNIHGSDATRVLWSTQSKLTILFEALGIQLISKAISGFNIPAGWALINKDKAQ